MASWRHGVIAAPNARPYLGGQSSHPPRRSMATLRLPAPARALACALLAAASPLLAQAPATSLGYFRFPAVAGDELVFTAEGDLWRVPIAGGVARRLTSHAGPETHADVSPDGRTVAFSASYEGPTEVYTMPLDGSAPPTRRTWEGGRALVAGWTPDGRVLYSTSRWSGLPNQQLVAVDPRTNRRELVPLAQAADGGYDAAGTLWFTRQPFQGSHAKRYKGGTAQAVWKFARGATEAAPVTADYPGTSKQPMPWRGRVYFLSDRDGTMNLWSMAEAGGDPRQHTRHAGVDAQSARLGGGRIAYQHGADLRVLDLASGDDRLVPVRLASDFEHTRERWVRNPSEWLGDAHLSPTGDRVVVVARGQVAVLPARTGRVVDAGRGSRERWRAARFMPDGRTVVGLTDRSGEVEFWMVPANGVGATRQLTTGASVLRWGGVPSPDGKWLAHWDRDWVLWLTDLSNGETRRLGVSRNGNFFDVQWAPDSRRLAYVLPAKNDISRLWLLDVGSGAASVVTTDRFNSWSPAFSPDGAWLYFLSDRTFESTVRAPWGTHQPEPFFDRRTKLYHVSLRPGLRSPFQPDDELWANAPAASAAADTTAAKVDSARARTRRGGPPRVGVVAAAPSPVSLDGIVARVLEVPLPSGNYGNLATDGKRLYFTASEGGPEGKTHLRTLEITNAKPTPETFAEDVTGYELSMDRKKVLVRRRAELFVSDAGPKMGDAAKTKVDLSGWVLRVDPRDEWRQMFADAWRLHRDYFYDRGMHGVDWAGVRRRLEPLVERVTDRDELSDLIAQMIGELETLHASVGGGDLRRGADQVVPATLGALLEPDSTAGGWRIARIYRTDPDRLDERPPLAQPGVDAKDGEVIVAINGTPTLSVPDPAVLLRNQADRQVLLRVKGANGAERDVVATPITAARDRALRYSEWEYSRRQAVEQASGGRFGYVHLRAMGPDDIAQWTREFYPAFDREAMIIDVRHNNGGNIDSWLLSRLLRRAWMYWQPRVGDPYWNMQGAFRGHVVVLANEWTASDGEAFAEGFRRLGLGKVIGTRTWGGEIWLTGSNALVDRGIATAAEFGVYGPEGTWLIEGHGVDPDVRVDNLPHATFKGQDAQLEAAIRHLEQRVKEQPVVVPPAPKYPVKGR